MFSLASGLYAQYFSPQQINVLVVGVKGVGKSTILERIKVTDFPSHSRSSSNSNATSRSSHTNTPALTIESTIATIASGHAVQLSPDEVEPLRDHRHHRAAVATGQFTTSAPELLRTKIFLSHDPHDFDAPAVSRRTKKNQPGVVAGAGDSSSTTGGPPYSRSIFSYICPAPPKFGARATATTTRIKDTSDRDGHMPRDDDDFLDMSADEWFDDDDIDDEDDSAHASADEDDSMRDALSLSMRSEKTYEAAAAAARVRIMKRSNSDPKLMDPRPHRSRKKKSPHHAVRTGGSATMGAPLGLPAPRRINATTTKSSVAASPTGGRDGSTGRMESIDLGRPSPRIQQQQPQYRAAEANDNWKGPLPQYDLKAGAKMLPLEKIRPTIGMNLAKTDACGAKVHVFDVSGKFQNLWERYYADADAVLFVWKLSRADAVAARNSAKPEADDDDESVAVTVEQQKRALEQVRSAVADDVPFCILGHLFQTNPPYNCEPDVLYSTSQLLPHYHNPHQALFLGNAVTGQGIKTCFEWLIGAAMRQQRIRERQSDLGKH